jgi:hypothetical protein
LIFSPMPDPIPFYPDEDEGGQPPPGHRRHHRPEPARQPAPEPPLIGRRLDRAAIVALVASAVLAVIITAGVVFLVAKQRATVGNPPENIEPYESFAWLLGIAGFAVIMTILEAWVIGSRDDFNYWVVIVPAIIFTIVLGIILVKSGKDNPSPSLYGMSAQPSVHLPRMHL